MSHTATCHLDPTHTHDIPELQTRSRSGITAVLVSLAVLLVAGLVQAAVFLVSGSAALLADLVHNVGDALTALPVGVAFTLRSARAERTAGILVVGAILISMAVAGITAVDKLISAEAPDHLPQLAVAGVIGVIGNGIAARIRSRAGQKLDSPALVADGHHARADALVSGGVVLSAALVALGLPIADPIIAVGITAMIGHIALEAWRTVRAGAAEPDQR